MYIRHRLCIYGKYLKVCFYILHIDCFVFYIHGSNVPNCVGTFASLKVKSIVFIGFYDESNPISVEFHLILQFFQSIIRLIYLLNIYFYYWWFGYLLLSVSGIRSFTLYLWLYMYICYHLQFCNIDNHLLRYGTVLQFYRPLIYLLIHSVEYLYKCTNGKTVQ